MAGCAGNSAVTTNSAGAGLTPDIQNISDDLPAAPVEVPRGVSIEQALIELETATVPQGVRSDVWNSLTAELSRVLEVSQNASGRGSLAARAVSTPPLSEGSQTNLSYDMDSSTLSWGYYSQGDYDQNGLVAISDLTPLGIHFGKESSSPGSPFPPDTQEAVVDGDGNGVINIADVTPIGIGFGLRVEGYRVYLAADESSYPVEIDEPNGVGAGLLDTIALGGAEIVPNRRKRFNLQIVPTETEQIYWVRPYDGVEDGTASNFLSISVLPNKPPEAVISGPGTAGTPARVDWIATGSSDSDGAIVRYEWDFDSDGTYDYDSGTVSVVPFWYYEAASFATTVRVTDNEGASSTAVASVEIVEDKVWQSTLIKEKSVISLPARDPLSGSGELIEVVGNPALLYSELQDAPDPDNGRLHALVYSWCENAEGTDWLAAEILDTRAGDSGTTQLAHIQLVNGNPAAVYTVRIDEEHEPNDIAHNYVVYIRSNNIRGTDWGKPQSIHGWDYINGSPEGLEFYAIRSFAMKGELPVVLGGEFVTPTLSYIEAQDQDGASWLPIQLTAAQGVGFGASVEVINERPAAVHYSNGEDVLFKRAAEEDVSADWGDPLLVDKLEQAEGGGPHLMLLGGIPAVIYEDSIQSSYKIRTALDADGGSWSAARVITELAGSSPSRALVLDGRPALIFNDRIVDRPKLIVSNDALGNYWSFAYEFPEEIQATMHPPDGFRPVSIQGQPAWVWGSHEQIALPDGLEYEWRSTLNYVAMR
jgi:hypothetical protein